MPKKNQTAHYDKCVINLREQHKPDMSPVLEYIFSHAQVFKKNILVTMLIVRTSVPSVLLSSVRTKGAKRWNLTGFIFQDQLCGRDPTLADELMTILNELTQLSKMENSKVALRARQVTSTF